MITVDNLLLKIINRLPATHNILSLKDFSVLKGLASAVVSDYFITESQSRLLIKVLTANAKHFTDFDPELTESLANPRWSKPFRNVPKFRTISIRTVYENLLISIEFTHSAMIKKIITNALRLQGLNQFSETGYSVPLTELNIVSTIDLLKPLGFTIQDDLLNYYNLIKSWDKSDFEKQYQIDTITNNNFQKHITSDLGIDTAIDQAIIKDRSNRYQYYTDIELPTDSLTNAIASRKNFKIFVDSSENTLSDVVKSLIELKRLPVLVVFDKENVDRNYEDLLLLSTALDQHGITNNIGIHFRMQNNTEFGRSFNQLIADQQYNTKLDINTKVAGVDIGKIPKFFLSNPWKPMSVLAIDTTLRFSKTSIYANCSDLIITYSNTLPFKTEKIWQN